MYLPNKHVPASPRSYAVRTSTIAGARWPEVDDEGDCDVNGGYHVDDEEGYDEDDYESTRAAGSASGWVIAITVLMCGIAGLAFMRRFGSLPFGKIGGSLALPPYNPPPLRTARAHRTVAPYPGDDAIYGPDAPADEIADLPAGPQAHWTAFLGVFGFATDSGS
jgi:hypothetical protein